jgi:uncharacterized protein YecE (DUF72 family)
MTVYHVGAQGFSQGDWVGTFYPPGTRPSDYLAFYAKAFDSVEMNTTFYATPTPDRVLGWVEGTPPGFCFAAKMSQVITHDKRLVDAEQELTYFCASMRAFGDKLGAIVIQLPPSFKRESELDLQRFLDLLPSDLRFAVEFRHSSWQEPAVLDLLRIHNVAWCMNDWRDLASIREATTDFAYLRLNGYHDRIDHLTHVQVDRSAELDSWAETLRGLGDQVRHAYVYVNNHYAGHAPATINDLRARLGLPAIDPRTLWAAPASPGQMKLFDK